MEEIPSQRRETFTSLQLQRAADQLQDAIQSVRQRRSMYSSRSTSLSLLSDSSDEEDDLDYDTSDDQENRPLNGSTVSLSKDDPPLQTFSPHHKLRRFMLDGTASGGHRSGASLSLKDLHASPLRPPRDPHTTQHHKQPVYVDIEKPVVPITDEGSSNDGQSTSEQRDRRDSVAEKAMAALQHELEDQARANRAMQEQLLQVVGTIHAFVAHTVGDDVLASSTVTIAGDGRLLNMETVKHRSEAWIQALERWRCAHETESEELAVRSRRQEEESQTKIHALETALKSERETMNADLESKQSGICALQERVDSLMSTAAISEKAKTSSDRAAMLQYERAHMEIEDLRARLLANRQCEKQAATVEPVAPASVEQQHQQQQQQRQVLDLLAQLKQSELRELQWEMLFDEQSQETAQTKERLDMLLEDVAGRSADVHSHQSSPVVVPSTTAATPHEQPHPHSPRTHRASFASSTTSSELQLCQQRIEFLEDQLHDVKEQINCDHHQFLYEQQKWELEKKHMGHDVEEVHDVSVKVLKLLLIREKLLKRHELKLQKRVDKLKRGEQSLQNHHELVLTAVDVAMQECAVALLYVRQLAMMAPSTTPTHGTVASDRPPVKPIKLVRLLKRLKTVQHELMSGDGTSKCSTSSGTSSSACASSSLQSTS